MRMRKRNNFFVSAGLRSDPDRGAAPFFAQNSWGKSGEI